MSSNTVSNAGEIIEVHISDIRQYKTCRQQWDFASPHRQNLTRRMPYKPFVMGRLVHEAFQNHYDQGLELTDAYQTLCDAEFERISKTLGPTLFGQAQPELEQIREEGFWILQHYKLWQQRLEDTDDWMAESKWKWINTEQKFVTELLSYYRDEIKFGNEVEQTETNINYGGRWDGLFEHEDGTLWIHEIKTAKSIKTLVDTLEMDQQAGMYQWAASKILGRPLAGTVYTILRKKEPVFAPRLKADWQLSQATSVKTSFEWYKFQLKEMAAEAAVADLQHSEESLKTALFAGHKKMLDFLWVSRNDDDYQYFKRLKVYRTPGELTRLAEGMQHTAYEMVNNPPIYTNPGWSTCKWCIFKAPCQVLSSGASATSVQVILNADYIKREEWSDPLAEQLEGV